ncbi:MAG: protein kinase [Gemmatimonadales bacterium]|nr:protein kinase [Gemmatimonadales bacterium]
MASLAERLQPSLAGRYRLERELGAGGMAIVWLAEDLKHRRPVAIKVLRPELAASIGPARFVREIEIAAQLQHPHILPLLDSGEADGLAYYVMPFVEGESLRDRLARDGALPMGEAVGLVREVADALAYAHRRGVVHRDVKPDNVMLADGHALVVDFGVAKAVSEARGAQVTTAGMAIGTPAYMAPEQAAGDPTVDARADIYALGCLAYELLGGRPPFVADSPQQVLAAHLTRAPEPLASQRPGLPPAVNDAIMRCLAKAPDDRWPNAAEFRAAMDPTPLGGAPTLALTPPLVHGTARVAGLYLLAAVVLLGLVYLLVQQLGLPDWVLRAAIALLVAGLPVLVLTGRSERRRAQARATGTWSASAETALERQLTFRRAIAAGGAALGIVLLGAGTFQALGAMGIGPGASLVSEGKLALRDKVVVADFVNRTADSSLALSVTEALRIDLAESAIVTVLGARQVSAALERMGRAPGSALDDSTAREVATREGAKAVVTGEVSAVGSGRVVTARLLAAVDGEELVALRETAPTDADLLPAIDRLSARLRERMGESLKSIRAGEPLEQVTTGSLAALTLYGQAQDAAERYEFDRAIGLLKEALAIDSGFAMAWRKLAAVYSNAGAPNSLRREAATRAYRFRDRLPPLERDQAIAQYFWSAEYRPDSAERAFRAVLARDSDNLTALNNYGMLLIRVRRFDEAEPLLRRAIAVDSNVASAYVNLSSGYAMAGRHDDAAAVLDALERRVPQARDRITSQRMGQLAGAGRRDSAYALGTRAVAGAATGSVRSDLLFQLGTIASAEGRLSEAGELYRRAAESAAGGEGDQGDAMAMELARAFNIVKYERDSARASQVMDEARRRFRFDSLPPEDRRWAELAWVLVEVGRVAEAKRLPGAYRAAIPAAMRGAPDWADRFEAELALRERRATPAQHAVLRAVVDSAPCLQCAQLGLGLLMAEAGFSDSAAALLEAGVALPGHPDRIYEDAFALPEAYLRLAEHFEQRGDRAKALDYYGRLTELWRDADPVLQAPLRDVRRRMTELTRAEGR